MNLASIGAMIITPLSRFPTICEGKSKEKRELIERRSKVNDWHGICCSFASPNKTTMALFAPFDTTNYYFTILSIL